MASIVCTESVALSESEIEELAELVARKDAPLLGDWHELAEQWPLAFSARSERNQLVGFQMVSLERIGGTPTAILGPGVLDGSTGDLPAELTEEIYRRAHVSFPDEDLVMAMCATTHQPLELLNGIDEVFPTSGRRPNGEERAWGRRLAKRFGVSEFDDEKMWAKHHKGTVLVEVVRGSGSRKGRFSLPGRSDGYGVCWGWVMAEDLESAGAKQSS